MERTAAVPMLRSFSWTNDKQPRDSPSGARVGGAGRPVRYSRYLVQNLETSFAEWSGLRREDDQSRLNISSNH